MKNLLSFALLLMLFTSCSSQDENGKCIVAGCSGQFCIEKGANAASTCEWNEGYRCYKTVGICAQQGNGKCGWTPTDELSNCLTNANRVPPFLSPSQQ